MNSKVENLCCQNSQENQRASAEQWIQSEVDGEDTRLQRPRGLMEQIRHLWWLMFNCFLVSFLCGSH